MNCFSPLQKLNESSATSELKVYFQPNLGVPSQKLKLVPSKPPASAKKSESKLKKFEKSAAKHKAC